MPGRYADSTCGFTRQNVAECPLSEMSKYFYDSTQNRFWGTRFAGDGYSGANCRGTNKSTQTAGVPLHTSKTGRRFAGCRRTSETICYGIAGIETVGIEITCDFAERENKIARTAVRSCSPT
jgi:hypothetical protein